MSDTSSGENHEPFEDIYIFSPSNNAMNDNNHTNLQFEDNMGYVRT